MKFEEFGFDDSLMDGIRSMGFDKPTPIQEQAIPIVLAGEDLIGCAQTGTGKTAAYVLPVIDNILAEGTTKLNTLILAPTRELALQIDQEIEGFSYYCGVSSIPIYGGTDGSTFEKQKQALIKGADIVIATPGRLIQQLTLSDFKLDSLRTLILDEADRMLDMGFFDDIMRIISHIPADRQTLLFSATMPPKIRQLATRILRDPKEITIAVSKPAEGISQQVYFIPDFVKEKLVMKILKADDYGSVLIFASRKETVKKLGHELRKMGLNAVAFSSDLEQSERQEIMLDFKSHKIPVLVGTDVLSRGIDVEDIGMVINFDVPPDPEDYIHRIGRTARAERKGTAVTFVNENDKRRFMMIEKLIGKQVLRMELPEDLAKSVSERPASSGREGGGQHRGGPHNRGGGNRGGGKFGNNKGGGRGKGSGPKNTNPPKNPS
jgi:ATP-dependent RNA helicase RhlE